jgi:hypothetical protein
MRRTVTLVERWDLVRNHDEVAAAARRRGLEVSALRLRELDVKDLKTARELDVREAWLECSLDFDWVCAYRLITQDGVPVVAELRIFPNESGRQQQGEWSARWLGHRAVAPMGGITSRLLREVKVGKHLRSADMAFDNFKREAPALARAMFPASRARRRGLKGLPDAFYASVARDYVAACTAGSRSPAADVARRRNFSKERIRRILYIARDRGLLDRTLPRRSGGSLTDRAQSALGTVPTNYQC